MSKIFTIILILVLQFISLPSTALALDSCDRSGIRYDPKWVPENSSNINLNFTIGNSNTFATLQYKQVKLHFDNGFGPWDDWETEPITIQASQFSITIDYESLLKKGSHEARLKWQPDSSKDNFEDFCSNITYQVGAPHKCLIGSLPKEIPPNSSLTIKFIGKPDTNYQLRFGTGGSVVDTTTDNQGQGEFADIPIPGNNGETVVITIVAFRVGDAGSCHAEVKISATAPPPPTPSPGPIMPSPSAKQCRQGDPDCSSAGGQIIKGCNDPNDPNDQKNPGIVTAIGCIHTNPAELVKDLMTWVLGISGGLAFLMMLLGAFQMLTSAGNPDTLRAGRERLTSAVIGLLFVIFAVLLLQIIGVGVLNIPGFK